MSIILKESLQFEILREQIESEKQHFSLVFFA